MRTLREVDLALLVAAFGSGIQQRHHWLVVNQQQRVAVCNHLKHIAARFTYVKLTAPHREHRHAAKLAVLCLAEAQEAVHAPVEHWQAVVARTRRVGGWVLRKVAARPAKTAYLANQPASRPRPQVIALYGRESGVARQPFQLRLVVGPRQHARELYVVYSPPKDYLGCSVLGRVGNAKHLSAVYRQRRVRRPCDLETIRAVAGRDQPCRPRHLGRIRKVRRQGGGSANTGLVPRHRLATGRGVGCHAVAAVLDLLALDAVSSEQVVALAVGAVIER